MPSYFHCDRVSFSYPTRRVLTDVSFTVNAGSIAGLIGENGVGKSTLLSLLAGAAPDAGTIKVPDRLGILTQETDLPGTAPAQALIDAAVAEVRALETDIERLSAQMAEPESTMSESDVADEYDRVLARAEQAGLWSLDSRIAEVLGGLGLSEVDPASKIAELSGGQRRRFALAALLLRPVDAMILDEPTNHLDDAAVDFLIAELIAFSGPIIVASHDRWFLDNCATDIIDLDPNLGAEGGLGEDTRQGSLFAGSFSDYLTWRAAARRRWEHDFRAQETQRAELETKLGVSESDIFHSTESKSESRVTAKFYSDKAAKTVGNRLKATRARLGELERYEIPSPPPQLSFVPNFPASKSEANQVALRLHKVGIAGRLRPVTLELYPGQSRLITGPNGAGKSTMLGIVAGEITKFTGELLIGEGQQVGYVPQDVLWPDPAATAEALCPALVDLGLLPEEAMRTAISQLSLGQQRRVALGMVLENPPEILILDEPTNHIALTLAEELEAALANYPGVCLLATHDRWLRSRWAGERMDIIPAEKL